MPQIEIPYTPFPIFQGFHQTAAREKCAIGSVGSGKTIALCGDGIKHLLHYPGSKGMLSRHTAKALGETTEEEFLNLLSTPPDEWEGDEEDRPPVFIEHCKMRRTNNHVDHIIFPNGSMMLFRGLDDWRKIMSQNLSWIGVDEANEIDAPTYRALVSRLRQDKPLPAARLQGVKWNRDNPPQQIALASNSHGHNWIWDLFVHNPTSYRRVFFSTSFDNPTLYKSDGTPGDYLMHLLSMPLIWVRRFVFCDLDAFEGQILEFSPEYHVHQHFTPPDNWDRAMGMDWGMRAAVAIVWWAREPGTERWYQYREWSTYNYFSETSAQMAVTPTVTEVANIIKGLEAGETIKWRAADPEIWRKRTGNEENQTVDYWFRTHGIYFTPGAPDYNSRINALNQLLHNRLLSVSNQCPITQIAMQQYQWEDLATQRDKDGPERPRKKNDHHVDAAEYLATLFMSNRPVAVEHRPPTRDELIWQRVKETQRRQAMLRRRR